MSNPKQIEWISKQGLIDSLTATMEQLQAKYVTEEDIVARFILQGRIKGIYGVIKEIEIT